MDGDRISVKIRVLSGEELFNTGLGGRFIVDLDSIDEHRSTYVLDYNHNEDEVIGKISSLRVEDGALVGTAEILSATDGDRAEEVIKRILAGTPYEVSPLLHTALSLSEVIEEGETATVNGRTVAGPIVVYRNTPLRGVAVCPYGTDKYTGISALKFDKLDLLEERNLEMDENQVVEEVKAAHPDLEEMITSFGLEDGVAYFREGLTIEEAKERDYENLKKERAERLASEKVDETAEVKEDVKTDVKEEVTEEAKTDEAVDEKEKEEVAALKATIAELSEKLDTLAAGMTALKAGLGESAPVSAGPVDKEMPDNRPAVFRMADKIRKNGIKNGIKKG